MNDNPHLMAIAESKMAQVRTNLEHGATAKADALLLEAQVYLSALHSGLRDERPAGISIRPA